jgi:rare lipoprotein A
VTERLPKIPSFSVPASLDSVDTRVRRSHLTKTISLAIALLSLAGCHHSRQQQVAYAPPPPDVYRSPSHSHTPADVPGIPATAAAPGFFDDVSGRPVFTETGIASWYGPKYNHHQAADGTIYDQNAFTAAHRTLPLGTTVRVTNLVTGQQTLVRITDRGPFSPGRVLDLSESAAKEIGLYRLGIAKVRIEAFAHASASPTGKWAVQTGPFAKERDAMDLRDALMDRYRGAKVAEFQGPTGYWVRIDPVLHDRAQAEVMQDWIGQPDAQSNAYLVRID